MEFTQSISFPRSGHGLLVNALAKIYTGDATFTLSTKKHGWAKAGAFRYCEFYRHCRKTPCNRKDTTFGKNHDFGLALPIQPNRRYLVQWRHPLPVIVSLYRLRVSRGVISTDSMSAWLAHSRKGLVYWRQFMHKWVRPTRANVLVLRYEDLIAQPCEKLREVLHFIDPVCVVDEDRLKQVVDVLGFNSRDKVSTFPYISRKMRNECDNIYCNTMNGTARNNRNP